VGKKYAIHPDFVTSNYDGDRHYISFQQLARLYGVNPQDCIVWDASRPDTFRGRRYGDYTHLYTRQDGDYKILDIDKE